MIADRTLVHGEDHREGLIDLANRAAYLGDARDARAALTEFSRLVERRTAICGPEHVDTLVTRSNQAHWRGESGDPRGAVHAYAELVPLVTQAFGAEHPRTIRARTELAKWRAELDLEAGIEELDRLLPGVKLALGAVGTLSLGLDLAELRRRAGHADQAIDDLTELNATYQRYVELDHPDALRARLDLARCLAFERGDQVYSHRILAVLADDTRRALGDEHTLTIRVTETLAVIEDRVESAFSRRLAKTFDRARSVSTTLTRLTGDVGLDLVWVRFCLTSLVEAGYVRVVRDGADVDLLSIAEHARFQLIDCRGAASEADDPPADPPGRALRRATRTGLAPRTET